MATQVIRKPSKAAFNCARTNVLEVGDADVRAAIGDILAVDAGRIGWLKRLIMPELKHCFESGIVRRDGVRWSSTTPRQTPSLADNGRELVSVPALRLWRAAPHWHQWVTLHRCR